MKRKIWHFCPLCGIRLEMVSRHGRDRRYCKACEAVHYENPLPATVAIVQNHEEQILLVRRAFEPMAGTWCLPGGFLETRETPEAGVLRELEEETGLSGQVKQLVGVVFEESPFYGSIVVIGYRVVVEAGEMNPGDDASEVSFFPLRELPAVAFESHRVLIEKAKRETSRGEGDGTSD